MEIKLGKENHTDLSSMTRSGTLCSKDEGGDRPFQLLVNCGSETYFVTVKSKSTIKDLKEYVHEKCGIPIPDFWLAQGGQVLQDSNSLRDYNIRSCTMIGLHGRLVGGAKIYGISIDSALLDRSKDYDFTFKKDDGVTFRRGGYVYHRPYGWDRIAVKVRGRFSDDKWLGRDGYRTHSSRNEWPIAYHGTSKECVADIVSEGFQLQMGKRFRFGKGIYSSPYIDVAAGYSSEYYHEGCTYKVVIQNRVNPDTLTSHDNGEIWLSKDEEDVRPYGICFCKLTESDSDSDS